MAVNVRSNMPDIIATVPTRPRQFLGEVVAPQRGNGLVLAEVVHGEARRLPMHSHPNAYFELILAGHYEEGTRTRRYLFSPFTLAFNPSGMEHDGATLARETRFFTVEMEPSWVEPFVRHPAMQQTAAELQAGPLLWLGLHLYREYLGNSAASPLTTESLVWEMLAETARWKSAGGVDRPRWWSRVKDRLHAQFREPLRMAEIAAEAGVHPVHVARVCRRLEGKTVGEYVQALRVRFACEQLARLEWSLAEVACEAGFADQSHLTRVFQKFTRTTPARFRQMLAGSIRKSGRTA
jgi:AraC family transcriptional regulator